MKFPPQGEGIGVLEWPLFSRGLGLEDAVWDNGIGRPTRGKPMTIERRPWPVRPARRAGPRRVGLLVWITPLIFALPGLAAGGTVRDADRFAAERKAMVETQVVARGVRNPAVLAAMQTVPRHLFVPPEIRDEAYADYPLPIGEGQTISQPYIVAFMTESLGLKKKDKVLEVGTGSGYQAAVLSLLAGAVLTIEINPRLSRQAAETLASLGYSNVRVRSGDGFFGWPEEAPFDAIIVTCAVDRIPPRLFEQLAEGGRLILPLGDSGDFQMLTLVTKKGGRPVVRDLMYVRFVPMTGEALKKKEGLSL
jgi:protein-L-isoaspartate(D-aspartate) O-methyltransferase